MNALLALTLSICQIRSAHAEVTKLMWYFQTISPLYSHLLLLSLCFPSLVTHHLHFSELDGDGDEIFLLHLFLQITFQITLQWFPSCESCIDIWTMSASKLSKCCFLLKSQKNHRTVSPVESAICNIFSRGYFNNLRFVHRKGFLQQLNYMNCAICNLFHYGYIPVQIFKIVHHQIDLTSWRLSL